MCREIEEGQIVRDVKSHDQRTVFYPIEQWKTENFVAGKKDNWVSVPE